MVFDFAFVAEKVFAFALDFDFVYMPHQ